jgi:hypothetical protein
MPLNEEHIPLLRAHIHKEAQEWVEEYIATRKAVLAKRRAVATNALVDSMGYALQQVAEGAVTNIIQLGFEEHGRYIDMRRLDPADGGVAYINALAKFIVDKGLYAKFVQQYITRYRLRTPPENVLQKLAWAMAKSRAARSKRRTPWYAKSSAGAVSDLYNRVATGMPEIIMQQLKQQFK